MNSPLRFDTLRFDLGDDGIALVTIDVPGTTANVISDALRDDLDALVGHVRADSTIKGVILTSAKSDFMAGGDLKYMVEAFSCPMTREDAFAIATKFQPTLRRIETCGKPFAAAINGPAMGGGLELALACHYRVAADVPSVQLALPEATLGLMPGAGGTQRLPRLIGIAKALPLMLKGTRLSAADALKQGVVHAVAAPDQIVAAARAWLIGEPNAQQPWDQKGFKIPGGGGFQTLELGQLYNLSATQISRDTQHNLPAPIALLSAVARGTAVPIDAGLHIEACNFAKLVLNPVARNIARTMFVSKGELDKGARRPQGAAPVSHRRIGVIGAGLMGAGVAQSAAAVGIDVALLDSTLAQAENAKAKLAADFAKRIAKGRMKQDKADALLARIHPTDDYAALADCSLVVEAVFEDPLVKRDVFLRASRAMKPGAILASNTSTLPITELATGLEQPERFIGMHFFSPVDRMPLVEVIVGKATSEATLAEAMDLVKALRKTPIVVNDSRGFFTTRVISAYIQEAFQMVGEGLTPALIDNVAKMAGFPTGPLAMMDELGMDNGFKALRAEREAVEAAGGSWHEPAGYQVQALFCEKLERRGRRSGKGFYDYPDDKRTPSAELATVFPAPAVQPTVDTLKQRLLYIASLEAARAMERGVINSAAEGDVGSVLGIGFPLYTGGVFSQIDTVGPSVFVAACDKLADVFGERFRPSDWLRQRAAAGQLFYPVPV